MIGYMTKASGRVGLAVVLVVTVVLALQQPLLTIGALAAVAVIGATLKFPGFAVSAWLVVILFTPFWTTFYVAGVAIGPAFLNIPVALGLTIRAVHGAFKGNLRSKLTWLDAAMVLGVILVITSQIVFDQRAFLVTNVVVALFGAYVVGRFARESVGRAFVVASVVLAAWGVVEFALNWHVFTGWFAEVGGIGPAIQQRGGVARSEASLGHAIAYGATLTAALPFTRSFKHPLVLQIILLIGVVSSVSRGPILAAIMTFGFMLYLERASTRRIRSILLLVVGIAVASVVFTALYDGSGQEELQSSSSARDDQLASTLALLRLFGPADGTQWDTVFSRYVTNGTAIVDSTYLRFALDFGWIATVLLLVPVVIAAIRVLGRRAGSASIAVTGQIPVLLVTSMITQWQTVFYLLVGLMIAEYARDRFTNSPGSGQAIPALTNSTAPRSLTWPLSPQRYG